MSCGCPCMRSIGLGTISGMLWQLVLSLGVSWLAILGREVPSGEVLDLLFSRGQ